MAETFPTATIDSEVPTRSPEHQATIDRMKAITDIGASWAEKNGSPLKMVEVEGGSKVESHDGVSFADIKEFIANDKPENSDEVNAVEAARLFNRIAIEANGFPAPEDLSRMDTTSETARVDPLDVIKYGVAHLKGHLEPSASAELHETLDVAVEKYMAALGSTAESPLGADRLRSTKDQVWEDVRNRQPASEYPTLPEY